MELGFDTTDYIYTAIGAVGASLVLFGFYRTSIGRWTNKNLWYELDNVIGPILLIIYSAHFEAYISIIVNTIWIAVAFRGLMPFAERYGRKLSRKAKIRRRLAAVLGKPAGRTKRRAR
jgi:hypothetical protein